MWIDQELKVGRRSFHLLEGAVAVDCHETCQRITLKPVDRVDANRLSIALRLASKRMEEIGKELS